MTAPGSNSGNADKISETAAGWLARLDRNLTASEQDAYLQWLSQDPQHGLAVAQLGKTWNALDALHQWRPSHSALPNPDLLARPLRRRRRWWRRSAIAGLAAAASIALGVFTLQPDSGGEPAPRGIHVLPKPEQLTLADGSVVELNQGGKIETDFTPGERRVRLVSGEAHFKVAKNPARPFIVDAGGVAVRAVGTAFEVRRGSGEVEVLVTEGKVHVERPAEAAAPTPLVAGERALVDTRARAIAPVVTTLTAAEIDRALAWQGVRLEFAGLPLSEVVAEFNLRNPSQIRIADAETANLHVAGTFGATNVDGFVRLMEMSFGVAVERLPDGTVILRRAK
jgi:transmembrane sensor